MKQGLKFFIQFLIFLGLGMLILYLMYDNQSEAFAEDCVIRNIPESECSLINKLIDDFSHVKLGWIVLICALFMLSNILRALRWHQLLEPMGYQPRIINSIGAVVIAYFANLGIPRIGEVVRAGTISKYENIPIEKAMGTIVIGRILDFVCLFVVMALAFLLSFNTFAEYFRTHFEYDPKLIIGLISGIGILGLTGIWVFNKILSDSNSKNRLVLKIQSLWRGFKDGFGSILKVKNIPLLIIYSAGIWTLYYLMIYLCFFAYEPTANLGPLAGLVAFVFGSLGIVFPSPGGVGSYQFMVSQALIIFGVASLDAFTFSNIVFFAIQIFGNILFGILFLIILPFYNRK